MKGETKPMKLERIAETDVRPAEERTPKRRKYREWEDPDLNYMVYFSKTYNTKYEA